MEESYGKVQVKNKHYFVEKYNSLSRFISYFYQIKLTASLAPENILEIGVGNNIVADYFRRSGVEVATCDIDKSLDPDFIEDIRELPFGDNSFDVVMACEVLEHTPYEDFAKGLSEIRRVTRKYAVISLPYKHTVFEVVFRFPLARTLFKKKFLDLCMRIPLRFRGFEKSGEHYWEIARNYPMSQVKKDLSEQFNILVCERPIMDSYHQFFILEKKG